MRIGAHECKTGPRHFIPFVLLLACLSLAACEGGNSSTMSVTAAKKLVLVNYSTTVVANFANYTSDVVSGSTVNFSVSPSPASFSNVSTVTERSVRTMAGGIAAVKVRSPKPGTFTVSAVSGHYTGSTTVTFIDQPATVRVEVGLNKPIANAGRVAFQLWSDLPAPTFTNFSSISSAGVGVLTAPVPLAAGVPTTDVALTSVPGTDLGAGSTLFAFTFVPVVPSVPNFSLSTSTGNLADINATPVTPDLYLKATYYDAAGKVLYP